MLPTPLSLQGKTYIPTTELGHGRYGVVYKGYGTQDIKQENPYAIKFPTREAPCRLRNTLVTTEAHFFQQFNHHNFLRYVDHSTDHMNPFLVIELINKTLANKVTNEEITQQIIEDYIAQIPSIILELTEKNVTHGDLHCNNIAYENRVLKVLDPLAEISRKKPYSKQWPAFYAPEFKHFGEITIASDIYTLGKNIELMLTKEYEETSERAIRAIELYHDTKLPSSMNQLLHKITAWNQKERATPTQLEELCQQTVIDLKQKEYFLIPRIINNYN